VLHGRSNELARISQLLEGARSGSGGALTVFGEAGTGKSALLSVAADSAEGMRVLRTQGIESEAPLPFAALQRLLQPLLPLADRLPAPQADALRAAFGYDVGDSGDRFLLFLGALGILAEAAEDQPVLAVVDDAHWLDDGSAAALLFVARRLQMESVAMLFGAREGDVRIFDPGDLQSHRLTGLSLDAVTKVLRDRTGIAVPSEVSAQLLASTGGNPLALVELPEVLSPGQLSGRELLPGRLPVTGTVERVFLARARRLSAEAQLLLLLTAADDSASVHTVAQAASRLGVGMDALGELEGSALVRVVGGEIRLRHPLVRSAVYSSATTVERHTAHAALADVLTAAADADRRAWHRASSVTAPDATVVAELDAAAHRAERRGGHEAASAAWERAAELSTRPEARVERLYRAAWAAWVAGRPSRAGQLTDAVHREVVDPLLRADNSRLRARVEWNTASVKVAHRMLLEAAQEVAADDPDRAREIAAEAAAIAAFGGESGIAINPASFAGSPPPTATVRQRCYAELLIGLQHVLTGDLPRAQTHLSESFAVADGLGEADYELLPNLGVAAWHVGDYNRAAMYTERLLAAARSSGTMVMVLYALTRLVISDYSQGRWSTAVARATEAVTLGEETRQEILAAAPRGWLLLLAAHRGQVDPRDFDAEVADLTERSTRGILGAPLRDVLRWAEGARALSMSQAGAAFHHLAQMSQDFLKRNAAMDRIEAAVRAGQLQTGALWAEDMDRFAGATGQPWAAALAAHGRALLTDDAEAEKHFLQALRFHAESPAPFNRARTQLAYGEHLRRVRRRIDARDQLRAALETFQDLKAAPWAERATQELRASGETARRRDPSTVGELTPQELQVAQMVQKGLTNKEVAAQLFVSPRTVDFHLRNIFGKTGVSSRVELARLILS
jgi:DNA-binding CsgD family transcriptional regulator